MRGDPRPDLRRAVRADRLDQVRHRLLVLGVQRLPGRAFVLVRLRRRRDRCAAAGQRVARGDGRCLGALRGLGEDPDGRGRHRPRLRLRQVLGQRAAPDAGHAARPLHDDSAVARHRVDRGPAGTPGHGTGTVGREVDGRGRGTLAHVRQRQRERDPQGRDHRRGGPGRGTVRRPATPRRLRPGLRRCCGHRALDCGRPRLRQARRAPRLDHRLRAPH